MTEPVEKTVTVVGVSPEVIGYYLDNNIHQFVETADGKFFMFESIAVHNPDKGFYYVDHPTTNYIVYNNLLYRELAIA